MSAVEVLFNTMVCRPDGGSRLNCTPRLYGMPCATLMPLIRLTLYSALRPRTDENMPSPRAAPSMPPKYDCPVLITLTPGIRPSASATLCTAVVLRSSADNTLTVLVAAICMSVAL